MTPEREGEITLVTGATGFVGSHVAEALAGTGRRVRCTVRASSDLRWLEGLEVETVTADLREPGSLEGALEGVDVVMHLAGVTRAADPALFRQVNAEGTERLAREALRAGVRRFVFVSSLAARGPDGAGGPVSGYGRSKREAEARLRALALGGREGAAESGSGREGRTDDAGTGGREEGEAEPGRDPGEGSGAGGSGARAGGEALDVVALRPGGVYGPRDTDLLPLFRLAARGWLPAPVGGPPLQPVYVGDVARAVLRAAERSPGFGPWPLAEAGRYGWRDVAEALEDALGRRVRTLPVPGRALEAAGAAAELWGRLTGRAPEMDRRRARDLARHRWSCDPRPAEEALGWEARTPLPVGVRRTVRWYREAGWI